MTFVKSLVPTALALMAALGPGLPAAAAEDAPAALSFIALGPLPSDGGAADSTLRAARAEKPELVLQLGLASAGGGCSAADLAARAARLDRIDAPVLALPGKGDRQACAMAHGRPEAALDAHRDALHDLPWQSRGGRKIVTRSDWTEGRPENARVTLRGVAVVTAGDGDAVAAADWIRRSAAAAKAEGAEALVAALPSDPSAPGMEPASEALREAAALGLPLLVLHPLDGDAAEGGLAVQPGGVGAPMIVGIPTGTEAGPTAVSVEPGARSPFSISVTPPVAGARTADGGQVILPPDHG